MYGYKALKRNGKRIDEHRLVMEIHLGRKLTRQEVVHHIDGVKQNNELSNLELMSLSNHTTLHQTGSKTPDYTKEKLRKSSRITRTAAKLSLDDVRNIKRMLRDKIRHKIIAWIYRVHLITISKISNGTHWSWVDADN